MLFTKENLSKEIVRFYKEFNTLPTPTLLDRTKGYPSRKTFEKYFGSMRNAVEYSGFEYTKENIKQVFKDPRYDDKENLKQIILDYISEYSETPSMRRISEIHNKDLKNNYRKHFGSWNKCLTELGIGVNSVSEYTDEELENAVRSFVDKYKHTPSTRDFNKTGTPSFWCYQNKFGSWNNAMIHYGYSPNDINNKSILDDGEVCASGYENTISNWLKDNNVSYVRDVPYIDFIDNYNGKMNCDYKIFLPNGDEWYVEMAGFLIQYDYKKLNDVEKKYLDRLNYKKKLLKRQGCNYIIITVDQFRKQPFREILYFLNIPEHNLII